MSADLAAFLAARYDEAEAREHRMLEMLARADPDRGPSLAVCFDDGTSGGAFDYNPWDVIADYDPAHRLADVKLKRAILAEHAGAEHAGGVTVCAKCYVVDDLAAWCDYHGPVREHAERWPCATVRQLGTEFAGHPLYKESWKPE